tara:strand:+ start:163 stop:474 length:312 start_codon:yes stop_codon:yes gene_type:complete
VSQSKKDEQKLLYTSTLCKLDIQQEDRSSHVNNFEKILSMIDQLSEVDTSGVESYRQITIPLSSLRQDDAPTSLPIDTLKQVSPYLCESNNLFEVPIVIDETS